METNSDCIIDWFDDEEDYKCNGTNLIEYFNQLIQIKDIPFAKLSRLSSCYPKCEVKDYDYEIKNKKTVSWTTNWISSFYLEPKSSSYEESAEYLSYDSAALIGDVGGYLGLFLGWSLFSIIVAVPTHAKKLLSKLYPRRNNQQELDI